jgi:hypothetical protein
MINRTMFTESAELEEQKGETTIEILKVLDEKDE